MYNLIEFEFEYNSYI